MTKSTLEDYIIQRKKNKIKKQLRLSKPYLMGARLEQEVDRLMGIVDSGKMDWLELVENTKNKSAYSTPESITKNEIEEVSEQTGIKTWVLYWFYKQKLLKLKASGREKNDYLALLKEMAAKTKKLNETQKVQALMLYSREIRKKELSAQEALRIVKRANL